MPQPPDSSRPFRFAYFGTPHFSTLVLEELANAGFFPSLIVTAPDKPAGRGLALTSSPAKQWALARGIEVFQPDKFDDATIDRLAQFKPDLGIVAAYGKILPQRVLDLFPKGMLNVHPSLLPRYRGMSPVESQILADENDIGVSIILMDAKMDHGPLVAQEKITIPNWPVNRDLANEFLWQTGGTLLATTLPAWLAGSVTLQPQDESQATVTKKTTKEDGELDLAGDARANYLKYLAYAGWPGVYFFADEKRAKITAASFKNNQFIIERVIPEGKREMSYEDFSRKG